MQTNNEYICPTCGKQHTDAFCRNCGEPRTKPLSFKRMLGDFIGQVMDWELAWPKTLRDTFLHPGQLSRAYLSGSRKPYVNPLKYAFILVTVYSLVILGFDIDVLGEQSGPAAVQDVVKSGTKIVLSVNSYLELIAVLPMAWSASRFFKNSGYEPAEYYGILLFWLGNLFLITTLFALSGLYGLPHAKILRHLIALAHLFVWFGAFHNRRDFGLVWRVILLFTIYKISVIICGMTLLIGGGLLGWIDWSPFVAKG